MPLGVSHTYTSARPCHARNLCKPTELATSPCGLWAVCARFVCPQPGCEFASLTSAVDVWEHAENEHKLARDAGSCLWEHCCFGRKLPPLYVAHEGTHTGVWPHHCPKCKKNGYAQMSEPASPQRLHPLLSPHVPP